MKMFKKIPPLLAAGTGEAVEVVHVVFGPHHHFKSRNDFAASGAVARRTEESGRTEQPTFLNPFGLWPWG